MWVIDDKSGSLLVNTGDLKYMGEPLIIATASSILDAGRGPVFKYPSDGGKKLPLAESFERNKIAHFCSFRPQFVDTLFIVRLSPNMSMRCAVIINYFLVHNIEVENLTLS